MTATPINLVRIAYVLAPCVAFAEVLAERAADFPAEDIPVVRRMLADLTAAAQSAHDALDLAEAVTVGEEAVRRIGA